MPQHVKIHAKKKASKLSKPSGSGKATESMAPLRNASKATKAHVVPHIVLAPVRKRTLAVCYSPDFKLPHDFNSLPHEYLSLWHGE